MLWAMEEDKSAEWFEKKKNKAKLLDLNFHDEIISNEL